MRAPTVSIGVTYTGTSLLEGLRNPDNQELWSAYVGRYRPMLVRTLTRAGMRDQDAEDIAQQTLIEFATAYREGRYERSKGRLRSWLLGILKNQARNWRRRRAGVLGRTQNEECPELEDDGGLTERWEEEWRQAVLRQVLAQVQREVLNWQWEAFRLFVLEDCSAREAGTELGIPAAKVYSAKRLVMERVRALRPLMADLL